MLKIIQRLKRFFNPPTPVELFVELVFPILDENVRQQIAFYEKLKGELNAMSLIPAYITEDMGEEVEADYQEDYDTGEQGVDMSKIQDAYEESRDQ